MDEKKKLLYMDDDPHILHMVGDFFNGKGYSVLLAEDGQAGLEIFHDQKPDIVLVDLNMPRVDGFEVLQKVRQESPDTPVIVISGEGEMADVIQALRFGAWNYHPKPIENFTIIQHAVEQALEKAQLIKENKAYQEGLEEKLGTIIENYPGYIYTCDNNCMITYANTAMKEYLGHDPVGKKCNKAFFDLDTKCVCCMTDYPAEGKTFKHEVQNQKDGRWYFVIHTPVVDQNGEILERQIILSDITERKQMLLDLQEREEYLRKENIRLRSAMTDRYKFGNIIGKSKPMQEVYETIFNAAASDASVIIYGESGTGKELVAHAIHENSDRKNKKLVYVNCGAIPENLFESEFFGYKKGAFTGAMKDKYGFLDLADGGTLFLDEVGEIPMGMQVKLLRAIEGGGYTPVGGTEVKTPDVRIVAATNRDLKQAVREGLMRQDFLYRIHIIPIEIPPLRNRKEDIPLLVDYFMSQYDKEKTPPITPAISKSLEQYDWPGNVRELQNTIKRFITLNKLDFMGLDLSEDSNSAGLTDIDLEIHDRTLIDILEDVERQVLVDVLEKHNWQQGVAAKTLSISPKTMYRKMKQFHIKKPT